MAIIITLDARGYCARSKVTRRVPLAILITLTSAIIYLKIIIFKNVLKDISSTDIIPLPSINFLGNMAFNYEDVNKHLNQTMQPNINNLL